MQQSFRPKVTWLAPSQIKAAPFNPEDRTLQKEIKDLTDAVREIGAIVYPLIVASGNELVDGHRRLEVAIRLNMPEVPVIEVPYDRVRLFTLLNSGQKAMTGPDWLQLRAYGIPLEMVRKKRQQKFIAQIEEAGGIELVEELANARKAPSTIEWARKLAKYINNLPYNAKAPNEDVAMCLRWMIRNKQVRAGRQAFEEGMDRDTLSFAIRNNRKLGKEDGQ